MRSLPNPARAAGSLIVSVMTSSPSPTFSGGRDGEPVRYRNGGVEGSSAWSAFRLKGVPHQASTNEAFSARPDTPTRSARETQRDPSLGPPPAQRLLPPATGLDPPARYGAGAGGFAGGCSELTPARDRALQCSTPGSAASPSSLRSTAEATHTAGSEIPLWRTISTSGSSDDRVCRRYRFRQSVNHTQLVPERVGLGTGFGACDYLSSHGLCGGNMGAGSSAGAAVQGCLEGRAYGVGGGDVNDRRQW